MGKSITTYKLLPDFHRQSEFGEFISSCLSIDAEKRPTIEEVIKRLEEVDSKIIDNMRYLERTPTAQLMVMKAEDDARLPEEGEKAPTEVAEVTKQEGQEAYKEEKEEPRRDNEEISVVDDKTMGEDTKRDEGRVVEAKLIKETDEEPADESATSAVDTTAAKDEGEPSPVESPPASAIPSNDEEKPNETISSPIGGPASGKEVTVEAEGSSDKQHDGETQEGDRKRLGSDGDKEKEEGVEGSPSKKEGKTKKRKGSKKGGGREGVEKIGGEEDRGKKKKKKKGSKRGEEGVIVSVGKEGEEEKEEKKEKKRKGSARKKRDVVGEENVEEKKQRKKKGSPREDKNVIEEKGNEEKKERKGKGSKKGGDKDVLEEKGNEEKKEKKKKKGSKRGNTNSIDRKKGKKVEQRKDSANQPPVGIVDSGSNIPTTNQNQREETHPRTETPPKAAADEKNVAIETTPPELVANHDDETETPEPVWANLKPERGRRENFAAKVKMSQQRHSLPRDSGSTVAAAVALDVTSDDTPAPTLDVETTHADTPSPTQPETPPPQQQQREEGKDEDVKGGDEGTHAGSPQGESEVMVVVEGVEREEVVPEAETSENDAEVGQLVQAVFFNLIQREKQVKTEEAEPEEPQENQSEKGHVEEKEGQERDLPQESPIESVVEEHKDVPAEPEASPLPNPVEEKLAILRTLDDEASKQGDDAVGITPFDSEANNQRGSKEEANNEGAGEKKVKDEEASKPDGVGSLPTLPPKEEAKPVTMDQPKEVRVDEGHNERPAVIETKAKEEEQPKQEGGGFNESGKGKEETQGEEDSGSDDEEGEGRKRRGTMEFLSMVAAEIQAVEEMFNLSREELDSAAPVRRGGKQD